MERTELLTKEEWKKRLEAAGVTKGARVLFQSAEDSFDTTPGGAQTVLEALMELVGPQGTLCVPAFTRESLDPSAVSGVEMAQWGAIRKSLPGFDVQLSLPDSDMARALMLYPEIKRTDHPVKSFLFWGTVEPGWLKQPGDFPLDFESVLGFFEERWAKNILVNLDLEESLLYQAMAHYVNLDIAGLSKAVLHKQKRNTTKVFLDSRPRPEEKETIRELLDLNGGEDGILSAGLYSSPSKTREIFFKASSNSEEKLPS